MIQFDTPEEFSISVSNCIKYILVYQIVSKVSEFDTLMTFDTIWYTWRIWYNLIHLTNLIHQKILIQFDTPGQNLIQFDTPEDFDTIWYTWRIWYNLIHLKNLIHQKNLIQFDTPDQNLIQFDTLDFDTIWYTWRMWYNLIPWKIWCNLIHLKTNLIARPYLLKMANMPSAEKSSHCARYECAACKPRTCSVCVLQAHICAHTVFVHAYIWNLTRMQYTRLQHTGMNRVSWYSQDAQSMLM